MIDSPDVDTMDIELDRVITQILDSVTKTMENSGDVINESDTERIVIDRLLPVLGYEDWDLSKRKTTTNTGTRPDYTILPNHEKRWYLEAKQWQLPLEAKEASQAVTYAYNQGNRWAVLTNGDEWRVYDAFLCNAPLEGKCTISAKHLSEAKSLLKLLAKKAMLNGEIEKIHHREHVLQAVREEIGNENSATIRLLRKVVEKSIGAEVTKQDILDALKELMDRKNEAATPNIVNKPDSIILPTLKPSSSGTVSPNPVEKYSLKDLAEKNPLPVYYKTVSVSIDGNAPIPVKNWKRLTTTVIEWFYSKYGLPDMPFTSGSKSSGKRYFMNTTAYHPDGTDFIEAGEINISGQPIYIEMNYCAFSFCVHLEKFITDMGGDSSNTIVEMVKK